MISNIPSFAVHQDYQARHSDMLAAARQPVSANPFHGWYEEDQEASVVFGLAGFFAVITGGDGEVKSRFGPYLTKALASLKANELTARIVVDKSTGNGQP
jgi:hypothetical protein